MTPSNSDMVDVLTIDAAGLKTLLARGNVTSQNLVKQYLAQIQRHDGKLHAMIQTTPIDLLEKRASMLDQERAAGKTRGPLHGIPIIIKACCNMRLMQNLILTLPRTTLQHIPAWDCGPPLAVLLF